MARGAVPGGGLQVLMGSGSDLDEPAIDPLELMSGDGA